MNLSNIPQSSPLSNYNRSQADKTFADADETLLGHLVLEQGLTLQDALENLRPHVKQAKVATELATDWTGKIGFGSIAVGVLLGTSIGAPLAIPPLLAGCLSLKFWGDSRNEKPRRDAEYRLLRDVVPQLPEFLWGLHLKGCSAMEIIGAYDGLVSAIESAIESGKTVEEQDVSAYLWHKIEAGRNFQGTLTQGQDQDGEPEKLPQTQLEQPKDQGQDQDAPTQQQPESLAPSAVQQAVKPSYGQSKVLSPLDRLLSSPYLSRAVFGAQRTGKSYLAAIASQQMHIQRGTKVFHINLHSYGDEDARYWVHAQSARGDMGHLPAGEVATLIDRAMAIVQAFKATRNALLIVDEIVLTGAISNPYAESLVPLMQQIAAICTELASTGKKRQQAIWTLSPDFVAGAVTQECKAIKSLAVTFVAIPKGRTIDWDGQAIGFHAESFGNVQRNWPALKDAPAMDCDRICWVDGLWLDLGELPPLMDSPQQPPAHPEMAKVSRESLERLYQESPSLEVEQAQIDDTDPMIELLESEPDPQMRKALLIGYRWARSRISEGKEVTKDAFLNRAKNERKCDYLRENRSDVWDMLDGLIF